MVSVAEPQALAPAGTQSWEEFTGSRVWDHEQVHLTCRPFLCRVGRTCLFPGVGSGWIEHIFHPSAPQTCEPGHDHVGHDVCLINSGPCLWTEKQGPVGDTVASHSLQAGAAPKAPPQSGFMPASPAWASACSTSKEPSHCAFDSRRAKAIFLSCKSLFSSLVLLHISCPSTQCLV